jgi:RimJ/RimL family protein N-acetyltransferase
LSIHIAGERLILRDLQIADIEQIYYWMYLAEDREHLAWNGPYSSLPDMTYEQFLAANYQAHLDRLKSSDTRRKLVIEIDGKLRGSVGWYWVSEETNWFEIGIAIYDSKYWSGGYGTEAFRMWMQYLFSNLDTPRLGIGTWSGNYRMIALAKKLGMIEEARVRKARIVRGEFYDAVKYGILREEWDARS